MKKFEELTFANSFMFGKVTMDPVICKGLCDVLVGKDFGEIAEPQREKFLAHSTHGKYVKLDMYAKNEFGEILDAEMQNYRNKAMVAELPLRIRYYQGMIDQEILDSGMPSGTSAKSILN